MSIKEKAVCEMVQLDVFIFTEKIHPSITDRRVQLWNKCTSNKYTCTSKLYIWDYIATSEEIRTHIMWQFGFYNILVKISSSYNWWRLYVYFSSVSKYITWFLVYTFQWHSLKQKNYIPLHVKLWYKRQDSIDFAVANEADHLFYY